MTPALAANQTEKQWELHVLLERRKAREKSRECVDRNTPIHNTTTCINIPFSFFLSSVVCAILFIPLAFYIHHVPHFTFVVRLLVFVRWMVVVGWFIALMICRYTPFHFFLLVLFSLSYHHFYHHRRLYMHFRRDRQCKR